MVLEVHPMLKKGLSFLSVSIQAAVRPSHERFACKLTCTFITGRSHTSVLFLAVARLSVRSKTSRFTPESTRISDPFLVHRVAARASGQRGICVTTSVVTLGISKCHL